MDPGPSHSIQTYREAALSQGDGDRQLPVSCLPSSVGVFSEATM